MSSAQTPTTNFLTKPEYVRVIPPVTEAEFQRLKKSIKEDGLLMPVVLNQDNYVLDGHHRLRACQELQNEGVAVKVNFHRKDFRNKPLEELMYVVNVNLYRRNLNVFQKAEVGIKTSELRDRLVKEAQERDQKTQFTSETAKRAVYLREHPEEREQREGSVDPSRSKEEDTITKTRERMAEVVGVSPRTLGRVNYILKYAPKEVCEALRRGTEEADKPVGIRAVYDQLRYERMKDDLKKKPASTETDTDQSLTDEVARLEEADDKASGASSDEDEEEEEEEEEEEGGDWESPEPPEDEEGPGAPGGGGGGVETIDQTPPMPGKKLKSKRTGELLHMFNQDFRTVEEEIAASSVDLILAFKFPDPKVPDDEAGKIHEHLMNCAQNWLKEGGLLVMHVPMPLLSRVMCADAKPPDIRYHSIIAGLQRTKTDEGNFVISNILLDNEEGDDRSREEWRPFLVMVKGPKLTRPIIADIPGIVMTTGTREELADTLVLSLCPPNGIMVDPFMSRGLLGESALKLGKRYIGIERESGNYLYALDVLQA